jgi:5-histidylcysteine sulfoxide synthase
MNNLKSTPTPKLDNCTKETILNYFENSWQLEDILFKSLSDRDTFYLNPDPLRNPLIFYLGHSAVFYINKLIRVNLWEKRINSDYEILFEIGVDPQTPEELKIAIANIKWPQVEEVWQYRNKAHEVISEVIQKTPLNLPIYQNHPLWALLMGIEHQRIHFETSSMLIRQLPVERVKRPQGWQYAPSYSQISPNKMSEVSGGIVEVGKPEDSPIYGWDSEYGYRQVQVNSFLVSKYLITNGEFREFVNKGGYENQAYWDEEAWNWKTKYNVNHPKFWLPDNSSYKYRAMFDEIELPLDWPVEVNHYEAIAYCRAQGEGIRLMSEAEWHLATYGSDVNGKSYGEDTVDNYNLNLKFGSPSPVSMLENAQTSSGIYDLRGNVWEWLADNFAPLSGFKPHFLYEDNSAPFFDNKHKMMLGGAWVTNGTEALKFYRNWFRPYFYQHAGFRIAQDHGIFDKQLFINNI